MAATDYLPLAYDLWTVTGTHLDGTYTPTGSSWTQADLAAANNDSDLAADAPDSASPFDSGFILLDFGVPHDIHGVTFYAAADGDAIEYHVLDDVDFTTSTWTAVAAPESGDPVFAPQYAATEDDPLVANVTAVRIPLSQAVRTVHFWGAPSEDADEYATGTLQLLDGATGSRFAGVDTLAPNGQVGTPSAEQYTAYVENTSSVETGDVTLVFTSGEITHGDSPTLDTTLFFSLDGENWSAILTLESIEPLDTSEEFYVRRVTPSTLGASASLRGARVEATTSTGQHGDAVWLATSYLGRLFDPATDLDVEDEEEAEPLIEVVDPYGEYPPNGDVGLRVIGVPSTQGSQKVYVAEDDDDQATYVEATVTSWTSVAATADAYTVNRTMNDVEHVAITYTNPPDSEEPGRLTLLYYQDGGGALSYSTGTFVETTEDEGPDDVYYGHQGAFVPLSDSWRIVVRKYSDPSIIMAVFYDFKSLEFRQALNDMGDGQCVIWRKQNRQFKYYQNEDEGEQNDIVQYENFWCFEEKNKERFRFLASRNDREWVAEDEEDGQFTISGSGPAVWLERAVVLPENFKPNKRARPRKFRRMSRFKAFKILFNEAQARGEIPSWIKCKFTGRKNSNGVLWPDRNSKVRVVVECGETLYDVLTRFCEETNSDWKMNPKGHLFVAKTLGRNKAQRIRFIHGVDLGEYEIQRDRREIANVVYVQGADAGRISRVTSKGSISRWGRRAAYIDVNNAKGKAERLSIARPLLKLSKLQRRARTARVEYHPVDVFTGRGLRRKAFTHYTIGDTVGIGLRRAPGNTWLDVRVVEQSFSLADGEINYEMSLEDKRERREDRLQTIVDRWERRFERRAARRARAGRIDDAPDLEAYRKP